MTTREVLLYEANIDLKKCTVYGLSARNDSGKTTLLRTISGLRKEPEGSILIQEGSKTLTLLESKQ
ncbi:ATP-binding cassette domain-containing protein [Priestia aryabhattai]